MDHKAATGCGREQGKEEKKPSKMRASLRVVAADDVAVAVAVAAAAAAVRVWCGERVEAGAE